MKPDAVGSYHDADGIRHEVLVRQTRGGWQVLDLDTAAKRARVIDTLDGREDGRPQAEAIARDYLTTEERTAVERGGSRATPYLSSEDVMPTATAARRTGPRTQPARRVALPGPAR